MAHKKLWLQVPPLLGDHLLMSIRFKMEALLPSFLGCLNSHHKGSPALSDCIVKKIDPLKQKQEDVSRKKSHQELNAVEVRVTGQEATQHPWPNGVPRGGSYSSSILKCLRKGRLTLMLSAPDPFHSCQLPWIHNKYEYIKYISWCSS